MNVKTKHRDAHRAGDSDHQFSEKKCIETAISAGITITNMSFKYSNFQNGLFDNGHFVNTTFEYCNFSGANLSEVTLQNCKFEFCSMQTACLNESNIVNTLFEGSRFGDTDIAGTKFSNVVFEDPSVFSLKFWEADITVPCRYHHLDGKEYPFSKAPIVVSGLSKPIIYLDTHVLVGDTKLSLDALSKDKLRIPTTFFGVLDEKRRDSSLRKAIYHLGEAQSHSANDHIKNIKI